MTKALLEWETIDSDQIDDIIEGRPPRQPKVPMTHTDSSDVPPTGSAPNANSGNPAEVV
jgi:cell division protease FtsH